MMDTANTYGEIRTLLDAHHAAHAKELAAEALRVSQNATLFYLYGLACARMGEYSQAMTAFMQSERLDPQSPAVHAKEMLEDIYAFRNTDMINP